MKLRGKIIFDVDAPNLSSAAEHERFFLECVEQLTTRFGKVEAEFREYKSRKGSPRVRKLIPKSLKETQGET